MDGRGRARLVAAGVALALCAGATMWGAVPSAEAVIAEGVQARALEGEPSAFTATLDPGETERQTLVLRNLGDRAATVVPASAALLTTPAGAVPADPGTAPWIAINPAPALLQPGEEVRRSVSLTPPGGGTPFQGVQRGAVVLDIAAADGGSVRTLVLVEIEPRRSALQRLGDQLGENLAEPTLLVPAASGAVLVVAVGVAVLAVRRRPPA